MHFYDQKNNHGLDLFSASTNDLNISFYARIMRLHKTLLLVCSQKTVPFFLHNSKKN